MSRAIQPAAFVLAFFLIFAALGPHPSQAASETPRLRAQLPAPITTTGLSKRQLAAAFRKIESRMFKLQRPSRSRDQDDDDSDDSDESGEDTPFTEEVCQELFEDLPVTI